MNLNKSRYKNSASNIFVTLWFLLITTATVSHAHERILFNDDWRFNKGEPESVSKSLTYTNLRPWLLPSAAKFVKSGLALNVKKPEGNIGSEIPFAQAEFDDHAWRNVTLPHDWAIEGEFKQEYPGETGKLKWWGPVWYRKHFTLPASYVPNSTYLEIDGAMSYSSVWCNGQFVGGWPYGYASWRVDLTPYVKAGGTNVIAIRLDSPPDSSRWYPGSGIYRNVWLSRSQEVQFDQWGISVTTPEVSSNSATVQVQAKLLNVTLPAKSKMDEVSVTTSIYELSGKGEKSKIPVATMTIAGIQIVSGGGTTNTTATLRLPNPRLWDVEHPNRYVAVTRLENKAAVLDEVETPFGIRTFQFTITNGFILNGRRVPINGVCDHHDLGALGSAMNERALERQLEILKAMGCNAIRTSHNPPAPELLDLCDRLGFVVMDETFDCWRGRKKANDYHLLYDDWHEADVRAFLHRDRNHPCIVLWSIGNEIPEQASTNRFYIARELAAIVHEEEPSRPVSAACNHVVAGYNGFQNIVDVFGYNYKPDEYPKFRKANPAIPLYGSETASCISSRGEYFFPVSNDKSKGMSDFQMSSYDLYAPRWAMTPDVEFRGQDENPFVAGEFVWTGFDYIGEPTPYSADMSNLQNYSSAADKARAEEELKAMGKIATPSRSSYFGIIDLAGFPKDRFYLYQARWRPDFPMAHILPHWNWPDRVGQVTPVHVYTSGDEAELFLNGKSLGRKTRGKFEYRLRWDDVAYQPGELKVVAYKHGKKWATDIMKTSGSASQLELKADRSKISANGRDLSFVTLKIKDNKGVLVPRAHDKIRFSISGPGEIVATDNGDATSFESFQSHERKTFNGMALVIVRLKPGATGKVVLTAEADGLKKTEIKIQPSSGQ